MKFSAILTVLFTIGTQAAIIPNRGVQLSFDTTDSYLANRPLSSPNNNCPIGWYPSENILFTGFSLPDGRIRVGGVDTWLTFDSAGRLVVASGTGPANFGVDENYHLRFDNSDSFKVGNEGGNYIVYGPSATLPSTSQPSPQVKIRVNYS
ncbi:uncharacterized protein SAPINGB_P001490 [Magnusiomyces paraingens]|uniref:Hyphally-regulated cell wall protein N-terminal domain-containing protein n=1 Tax=Magnusiomyces paraingens TaxID=2606893 RepID=A0A5E8B840_9ASCO|nr:uncharacterized protein SAPINGB_P001490 [Saprochaete ingens]VVT46992.1 unnamed protein product [Saprochaete ingens]